MKLVEREYDTLTRTGHYHPERLTLYRSLSRVVDDERCNLGGLHHVRLYARKFVYLTNRSWLCNNGYEKHWLAVYEDAQGREYRHFLTADYYLNSYYATDDDSTKWNGSWRTRPDVAPHGTIRRLTTGELL